MKKGKDDLPLQQISIEKLDNNTEVDLETALELCGVGRYQMFHCALMVIILGAAMLEMIGSSFVLPAAACDLDIPDHLRGIITSIPNIGVILTAPFWGRAADTFGRKPVLLLSTAVAGVIALLASFMPNLLSFALCKFAGSLFLSCPSSLGFAYAGELVPRLKRDLAVLVCNALLMLFASLCPIFAWGVLSYNWQGLGFQPWRVLTAVYATPLVLAAAWLTQARESPKFLVTKGKPAEALEVLRHIFAFNSRREKNTYCVTSLKSEDDKPMDGEGAASVGSRSAWALLRPPHLKWLLLAGFLMFGLFALLNGLFLFAPNTINKMMTQADQPATICMLMNQPANQTADAACVDSISYDTFQITAVMSVIYGVLVLLLSLSPLSKKVLLAGMYAVVGANCVVSALTSNRIIAGISMSALQITALGIGPLCAYTVQLFPTSLRGTAVGAVLMFGRLGSVTGANAAGIFLAGACTATFYGFAALLFLCAALSFLLPRDQPPSKVG
ncbi:synaptic vesicle glycoprotein 2C-like [Maniola hyperantus]|uniref:synaptic vesicle glycoprotein 2C-like n=1 Tax=Aphantopus hyperantus TaxID=2795564 RepID=UPI00374983A1